MFEAIVQDVRYNCRLMRKTRVFAAVTVLTLALAIGANTAIFSLVYGVILRPLPYTDPDRLVIISAEREYRGLRSRTTYSIIDLDDWRGNSSSFESIAFASVDAFAISDGFGSEMLDGAAVSPTFFGTIGGHLVVGRALGEADDQLPVAVVSEKLWRSRWAAASDVLGSQIELSAGGKKQSYTILGVVESSFQLPTRRTDVWIPSGFFAHVLNPASAQRGAGGFGAFARLKEGITIEQARSDVAHVSEILSRTRQPAGEVLTAKVAGLHEDLISSARPALLVLFAAVALVLVVASANVSNLLLARSASRSREVALRCALGASASRLVAQGLVESALLALFGGLGGLLIAYWSLEAIAWLGPVGLPRLESISINGPVLVFTSFGAILVAVLSGVLPALQVSGVSPAGILKSGTSYHSGRIGRRVRRLLVVCQLAISLTLLVGATLLGRSLANLLGADNVGIQSAGVIAGELNLGMSRMLTNPQQVALIDRLLEQIEATPSVVSAGIGNGLPPNGARMRFQLMRRDLTDGHERLVPVDLVPATPGFFRTLGIQLIRGRYLSNTDRPGAPPVMVISVSAARNLFGTIDVVGRTLPRPKGPGEKGDVTVVGVVGDVKYSGLDAERRDVIYRPFPQYPFRNVFVVTRASGSSQLSQTIRRVVSNVDPEITITSMLPLAAVINEAAAEPRFRTAILVALAALASVLAVIGLYGVVSYSVAQRIKEFGIRMAIGASRMDIMKVVMGEGIRLICAGIAIGGLSAYTLTRMLARFLFGIAPTDVSSFAMAAGLLLVVAAVASYVPAWRATRADPLIALRVE